MKMFFTLVRSGKHYKLDTKEISTVNSTVDFVTVVMAVINTVASVAVWDTFAVATGEGVGSTLQCGGLIGWVFNTRLLVGQQLHAIRTATHPL